MTEREWLQMLFEDVRLYFLAEGNQAKQKREEAAMRETMNGYMEAREQDDFDDA